MNDVLKEMRSLIETDPSGKLLKEFIRKQKSAGMEKDVAYQLLVELIGEYRTIEDDAEAKADAISNVADCVTGNIGVDERLIYPRES